MNVTLNISGTAPLLMHNNTLVDTLHDDTKRLKRISSKRTKTDEDEIAMRRIQFGAALYLDPEVGPYMPGPNIAKALLLAARIRRNGPKVERGLILISPVNRLEYDGPRDVSGLWNDPRFRFTVPVKVPPRTGKTVMGCRPIFPEWACTATAFTNPTVLPPDELADIANDAGQMIGLGDWRPWHGRFEVTTAEAKAA
jgi:hypothetical protein